MSASRGVVVIFSGGRIERCNCPVTEHGPDVTTCVEIDGLQYPLYRYTLLGVKETEYGFLGARTPPTVEERRRAAAELFGPRAFGIERIERVMPNEAD
jgi:hypothetical protein